MICTLGFSVLNRYLDLKLEKRFNANFWLLFLIKCHWPRSNIFTDIEIDSIIFVNIWIIGGHGFWDKGGVYTAGVSRKFFWPPSATEKFLRRLWHRGVIFPSNQRFYNKRFGKNYSKNSSNQITQLDEHFIWRKKFVITVEKWKI